MNTKDDRKSRIASLLRASLVQEVLAGLALVAIYDELDGDAKLFSSFVSLECGISKRTADRYMKIGRAFGDIAKSDPNVLGRFTQNAMVLLASKTCPEPARKAAIKFASAGNPVNDKKAKEFVAMFQTNGDGDGKK